MKVTICDRCGKRIEEKPMKIAIGRYESKSGRIVAEDFSQKIKDFDLCEECAKELTEFAKEKQKEDEKKEEVKSVATSQKRGKKINIDIEKLVTLRNHGMTYKEIAAELGVSEATACARMKKYEEKKNEVEELDMGKIRSLYRAKWSIKDIADEMRTSEEHIRIALKG